MRASQNGQLNEYERSAQLDLDEFRETDLWLNVMKPALLHKCNWIALRLARSQRMELEEVRSLQAEFKVLEELAKDPVAAILGMLKV